MLRRVVLGNDMMFYWYASHVRTHSDQTTPKQSKAIQQNHHANFPTSQLPQQTSTSHFLCLPFYLISSSIPSHFYPIPSHSTHPFPTTTTTTPTIPLTMPPLTLPSLTSRRWPRPTHHAIPLLLTALLLSTTLTATLLTLGIKLLTLPHTMQCYDTNMRVSAHPLPLDVIDARVWGWDGGDEAKVGVGVGKGRGYVYMRRSLLR